MSLTLTRKTDYALVALAALAEQQLAEREALSARQIAEQHQLPLPLLMNLLKDLHRGKIVCSRRGAGGGYLLCHDPAAVKLLDVIEAIEGTVKVALCCDEEEAAGDEACTACRVMATCPIVTPMQRFNDKLRGFLGDLTLADLIDRQTSPTPSPLKTTGASS
ncbi:MAG: Rrf2 family transcriptional regulator [Phycisphaeraceae bacterium]